jgi:hypothetical protein
VCACACARALPCACACVAHPQTQTCVLFSSAGHWGRRQGKHTGLGCRGGVALGMGTSS